MQDNEVNREIEEGMERKRKKDRGRKIEGERERKSRKELKVM